MTGTELIPPGGQVLAARDRRAVVEHRDPRGATLPARHVSPTLPQIDEWNAEQAFRLGYAANVVAYRCVQIIASAIARVPFVAGRKLGDAKTINERSPLMALLGPPPGGPAPKLSAAKLFRWTIAQQVVTGRRAWEIDTGDAKPGGRPVAFWPLAAANLRAFASKGGTEWFRRFETGSWHDPVRLGPDEVFYGWDPSGNDFRQAESALQACRYDLSLVTMCDRYSIGFLRNMAVPAAIVTTTRFPTEEHKRRFEQNWAAEMQGVDNVGRVHVHEVDDDGDGPVGDSLDVKVLGLSARDARLVEMRKDVTGEIAVALGVPWSKLDASGRTFDNADQEDQSWWEDRLLPLMTDLADDINMQLAPRLGPDVGWFDLRGVRALQPRRNFGPINVNDAVAKGWLVPNEARDLIHLEPIEGGDVPLEPVEPVVPPTPDVPQPPVELPAPNAEPDDDDEGRVAAHESRIVDPEEVEARRARIWRASDAVVQALERRWERAWRRLFARQAEATIARLTGKRGRQAFSRGQRADAPDLPNPDDVPAPQVDPAAVFDEDHWRQMSVELSQDLYGDTANQALGRLVAQFEIAFDLSAPWVDQFIDARAQQLAGQVTQTTYDAIRLALNEGVAAGESIPKLADRIRAVFAQAGDVRATTIARTEVISAYNGAATFGAAQLPADVVAGQEWIATRDGRTRESHASADGQVVAVGQPFAVGGASGAYPGDPALPADETVNCRCAVAFLTPDEFAEAQSRARTRVEVRTALAMLRLVTTDTDLIALRRSLTEVAA